MEQVPKIRKAKASDRVFMLINIVLFLVSFLVVIYVILSLTIWSEEFKGFFFLTNRFEPLIMLIVIVYILNFVLKKLLMWQYHAHFGRARK